VKLRTLGILFLITTALAQSPYTSITGQIKGPNGLPLANNTITFTPTQSFFVAGSGPACNSYVLEVNAIMLTCGDTVNFNATLPAAPTNGLNVQWQSSTLLGTDSVSAAIVGDGNSAHFLNGTGAWSTPGGGGGGGTVTSVTVTGDGTVESSTPSAPVTTAGTLNLTLANAGSGVFLGNKGTVSSTPVYATLSGVDTPKTATYQVLTSDFSGYKTIPISSGTFIVTLVASGSQPPAGEWINVVNYGSGTITIARSGQNINGGTSSLTLQPGSATAPTSYLIQSDGTNYFALAGSGGSSPTSVTLNAVQNPNGPTNFTTGTNVTTWTSGDFGASPAAGANVFTDASTSSTDLTPELYVNVPNTSYHQGLNISVDGFTQLQVCSLGASHVGITVIGNSIPCANLPTTTKTWIMDNSAGHTGLTIYQNNASAIASMLQLNNVSTSGFNFWQACSGTLPFASGGNGTCPNTQGSIIAQLVATGEFDLFDTVDPNVIVWTVNSNPLPLLSAGQSGIGVDTVANGGAVKCNSNGGGWLACGSGGGGAVSSVFTRTGNVVATTGDYTLAQITGFTSNSTGFSIAGGTTSKTNTWDNSMEWAGTDGTKMTFPTTNATIARTDASNTFTGNQFVGSGAPNATPGSGGGGSIACGTAATGVSASNTTYCDSANQPHIISITNDLGITATKSQTVQLTSSDWTCGTGGTVSSCTSAQTIGALTFTLPTEALSWTMDCSLVVGQATGTTANSWNIQTATNGATNIEADYSMATAATASAFGAITGVGSSTSTQVISPTWTLGATGTKMPVHIHATIEGASASGTVLNLQLVAPNASDLVTIYRGSSCRIY
jgi:hypothetical protein